MTTPVGVFANGASPYGCLDMVGNVWEWTRSLYLPYPFDADDPKRENPQTADDIFRVVRGGSWFDRRDGARCAYRYRNRPGLRSDLSGFRVVLRSSPVP